MAKRVDVEGIPGAGKTTFVTDLTSVYDIQPVYEPVKDNPFLDKFYRDPQRYAFNMQMWLLAKRSWANKAAYDLSRAGVDVIVDRGRQGDRCFAIVNHLRGNITDDELTVYNEFYEALDARDPDAIVFLDLDEEEAMTRIAKRGRECERGIELMYLNQLRRAHARMISRARARGVEILRSPTIEEVAEFCGLKKLGPNNRRPVTRP